MRLLLVSFYYHPDLSAGAFRATALAHALRQRAPVGTYIEIVTTLPNRYQTFTSEAPEIERAEGWEIRRIRLPAHRSDIAGQSRAFLHFARETLAHVADYILLLARTDKNVERRHQGLTLFLLPELNVKLLPKLLRELKPGTRIVSNTFDMGDWKPDKESTVGDPADPDFPFSHTLLLWRVPARAGK